MPYNKEYDLKTEKRIQHGYLKQWVEDNNAMTTKIPSNLHASMGPFPQERKKEKKTNGEWISKYEKEKEKQPYN